MWQKRARAALSALVASQKEDGLVDQGPGGRGEGWDTHTQPFSSGLPHKSRTLPQAVPAATSSSSTHAQNSASMTTLSLPYSLPSASLPLFIFLNMSATAWASIPAARFRPMKPWSATDL